MEVKLLLCCLLSYFYPFSNLSTKCFSYTLISHSYVFLRVVTISSLEYIVNLSQPLVYTVSNMIVSLIIICQIRFRFNFGVTL